MGGQDATEAFEDVGHSDEAREILEKLLIGDLKRVVCFDLLFWLSPFPFFSFPRLATFQVLRGKEKKKKKKNLI